MTFYNKTPHKIIFEYSFCHIKHYLPLSQASIFQEETEYPVSKTRHKTPIVLTPPLGVHSWAFDLMPERSLVKFLVAHGFEVYLIDWGEPSTYNKDISLNHYISDLMPILMNRIREHSGSQKLSLFGYSLGGLLNSLYTIKRKDANVANMVSIGSPFNFYAHPLLGLSPVRKLFRYSFETVEEIFGKRSMNYLFHIPGSRLSQYYKLTNPIGYIRHSVDNLVHRNNPDYLEETSKSSAWFDDMPTYPGGPAYEITMKMFLNNQLYHGYFELDGEKIYLENLTCSLLNIIGKDDKIVSVKNAKAFSKYSRSEDKTFSVVDGGHGGALAGSQAPEQTWTIVANWLAQRS